MKKTDKSTTATKIVASGRYASSPSATERTQPVKIISQGPPQEAKVTAFEDRTPQNQLEQQEALQQLLHQSGFSVEQLIGQGGMGAVYAAQDLQLQARVAMKVLHEELLLSEHYQHRFVEEACVAAQLTHPNIPPIHQLGILPDGRPYFTMREIQGTSLRTELVQLYSSEHAPESRHQHHLVEVFHSVCEAMAYAHSKNIIHRDLKPANIMLGRFGQVWVVDWGLVKRLNKTDEQPAPAATVHPKPNTYQTEYGTIEGTPAYMSPEQALGEINNLTARSDVYALGCILYEIISGRKAYHGEDTLDVLNKVIRGTRQSLADPALPRTSTTGAWVHPPKALIDICNKAMHQEPSNRYPSAAELAVAIKDWLDGKHREERAQELLQQALDCITQAAEVAAQSQQLMAQSAEQLKAISRYAPIETKRSAWQQEDQGKRLAQQAERLEAQQEHLLLMALQYHPNLFPAHEKLLELYQKRHQNAERQAKTVESELLEEKLGWHLAALPSNNPYRQRLENYLQGDGLFSLQTSVASTLWLAPYQLVDRHLVLGPETCLGAAPLHQYSIPTGSYRIRIVSPGHHDAFYPIQIDRQQHWDGKPPQATQTLPIKLLPEGTLRDDECYVPSSWFWASGDEQAAMRLPSMWMWIDGFVIKKHPVTVGQYLEFLNDLMQSGQQDLAFRYEPRERAGASAGTEKENLGAPLFGKSPEGKYFLQPDTDGDMWELDWPMMMLDYVSAVGYATWYSQKTGQKWRLPYEFEWEKAARGTDRRFFPWGNHFDHSWAHIRGSYEGAGLPGSIYDYPMDCSPYGVRGMCGNFMDWTGSVYVDERAEWNGKCYQEQADADPNKIRKVRGGAWTKGPEGVRICNRMRWPAQTRFWYLSFRIMRELTVE